MLPDTISTGSLALDYATQIGGWPMGHVVEVWGPESSGKTTLALLACRSAQLAGGACAFVDTDRTLELRYVRELGLDPHRLLVCSPDYGEAAFGVAARLLESGSISVVVLDSVAGLAPSSDSAQDQRKVVDSGILALFDQAAKRNALVFAINRPTSKPGRDGGWVEVTSSGETSAHRRSWRRDDVFVGLPSWMR